MTIRRLGKLLGKLRAERPKLNENDLEEKFISGWGPGGQAVNKAVNCVQLTHKPTNISVKVHKYRMLQDNQREARELLVSKLDDHYNGDMSLSSVQRTLALERIERRRSQRERQQALKKEFKKNIKLAEEDDT